MKLHNRVNKDVLKQRIQEDGAQRITFSFYQYAQIPNPEVFRDHLYMKWNALGVFGRIYVATEGINGQLSLPEVNLEAFRATLDQIDFLKGVRLNYAIEDDGKSFFKLTIKVRRKIVADGLNDHTFDVTQRGQHLNAEEFNALTAKPETIVVDMRNHYESEIGHFENALTPEVATFREALPLVVDMLEDKKEQPIVMYCTGGIRCEKASAYLRHKGFKEVYQLDGGIIEYARQVQEKGLPNKFQGKNFVFDERLGERISGEVIAHCHQCGEPADTHVNCANDVCHLLFIQCNACAEKYHGCCSRQCSDFMHLPEEERQEKKNELVFNGSAFPNGHYRAFRKSESQKLE
ncbi:MAG: rhodanese-related sulfurtransferase [Saprospirales bacterium]|nr:rhodanese-related sulfurtransferase [Saprospirales bacterium]